MSGRLIILPKKSYCPWNSKNVERVLRDERLHAEDQQQELEQVQKEASEVRLQALKKGNKVENKELEHVNLFRAEEQRELQQQLLLKSKQGDQNNKLSKGIQPLYLGQSAKNAKNHSTQLNKHHRLSDKEHRQKERMDPMHMFHSTKQERNQITIRPLQSPSSQEDVPDCSKLKPLPTDGEKEEKKRKKKRRSSRYHGSRKGDYLAGEEDVESESSSDADDDDDDDSSTDDRKRREKRNRKRRRSEDRQQQRERKREKRHGRKSSRKSHNDQSENQEESIEQLRKRRAEREDREKQRQQAVVQDKHNLPPSNRYMDQYNPNLSRR
jgi:hypothetical protein